MSKVVKIGGACAFYGDSSVAPTQLLDAGVDYLILDYLAEATMSGLGQMKAKRPDLGYAMDFTDWVWADNIRRLKETGTRIVTNAGGVNPQACVAKMQKIAADAGLSFRIAIVTGDDVTDRLSAMASSGTTEMFTGVPFPPVDQITSANAYLGATPIQAALDAGADVVITGRVVDSALTLGILMHEFGWTPEDHDKLSQGSLAGHVIECGAQATGGLFTDWEQVPDWAHIGYPIIECTADGAFIVTKPEGSGGLVSEAVVAEQVLYEVGDPQAYLLPDVACDFTQLDIVQVGKDRVKVTGSIGRAPTGKYKVCLTHEDGHRCIAFMPIVGRQAAQKAQRQAVAVVTRVEEMLRDRQLPPFRAKRVELLGAEASYGANSRAQDVREVVTRIALEHDDPEAFRYFMREFDSPTTSMSVGTTGWFGSRAQVTPVMRVFSTTIEREDLPAAFELNGKKTPVPTPAPAQPFDLDTVPRPSAPPTPVEQGELVETPLINLAWARSGDKGDAFNIGVIARKPEALPWIRAALTKDAMMAYFAHEFEGGANPDLKIYDLPSLNAVNLHFLDALGGGQFASLRLDPLAKGKAQQLLDYVVSVPRSLAP